MLSDWQKVIYAAPRDGAHIPSVIPQIGAMERVRYFSSGPRRNGKSCTFQGVVGVIAGIYLNSTAALAAVEIVSEEFATSSNMTAAAPNELSTDDYNNIDTNNNLNDDLIPATVWSLHDNIAVHLDRIRGEPDSKIYTGPRYNFWVQNSWVKSAFPLSNVNSIFSKEFLLPLNVIQFQVASCGGGRAEQKNLDYCSINEENLLKKEAGNQNTLDNRDGGSTTKNASDNVNPSKNTVSLSAANNQPALPLSTPTPAGDPRSGDDLIVLDPCGGAEACGTIKVDDPLTLADLPVLDLPAPPMADFAPPIADFAPPIADFTPPIADLALPIAGLAPPNSDLAPPSYEPVPPVNDLGTLDPPPGPPPIQVTFGSYPPSVFTPSDLKPIPEASTWAMIMIGFVTMVMLGGGGMLRRIEPLVIVYRKLVKTTFNHSAV